MIVVEGEDECFLVREETHSQVKQLPSYFGNDLEFGKQRSIRFQFKPGQSIE